MNIPHKIIRIKKDQFIKDEEYNDENIPMLQLKN